MIPTRIRSVSHREKIDFATTSDVPILELGHCRPRVLQAPRHQLDGARDDPLSPGPPHHLRTQSANDCTSARISEEAHAIAHTDTFHPRYCRLPSLHFE